MIDGESRPRLAARARLRRGRGETLLIVPERAFVLGGAAGEILGRCDGKTSVAAMVAALAEAHDVPAERVRREVEALLDRLVARGAVVT